MKFKNIFLGVCVSVASLANAQSIIVFPSDNWMLKNGFGKDEVIQGESQFICDYGKALRTNDDLKDVITRFGNLFSTQGFRIKPLDAELKRLKMDQAINSVADIQQSPTALILQKASPDIRIDIGWTVRSIGMRKVVDINVEALDPYSGEQITATSFTSPEPTAYLSLKSEIETMLKGDFSNFMNTMSEFCQMRAQEGRPVTLSVKQSSNSSYDLDSRINGKPLRTLIRNFLTSKSKDGQTPESEGDGTEYTYSNVYIAAKGGAAQDLQDDVVEFLEGLGVPAYAPSARKGTIEVYLGEK